MIRTFIAIDIPEDIRSRIADFQNTMIRSNLAVRWVKPENIHLTLKFIGEIPEQLVGEIKSGLFDAPSLREPFDVTLSGTGVFPNIRRPRIFWAGITSGAEELSRLSKEIQEKLVRFGVEKDARAFKPHLTIGRIKPGKPVEGLEHYVGAGLLQPGAFRVKEIAFMKSVLHRTGAEYSSLAVHSFDR